MTTLKYPDHLANVGRLSQIAKDSQTKITDPEMKDDLVLISNAAKELLSVVGNLTKMANEDQMKALGFIGLPMMGAFWVGYQRAMEDLFGKRPLSD